MSKRNARRWFVGLDPRKWLHDVEPEDEDTDVDDEDVEDIETRRALLSELSELSSDEHSDDGLWPGEISSAEPNTDFAGALAPPSSAMLDGWKLEGLSFSMTIPPGPPLLVPISSPQLEAIVKTGLDAIQGGFRDAT